MPLLSLWSWQSAAAAVFHRAKMISLMFLEFLQLTVVKMWAKSSWYYQNVPGEQHKLEHVVSTGGWIMGKSGRASNSSCYICIILMFSSRDGESQQNMVVMEMRSPYLRGGQWHCRNHRKRKTQILETDTAAPNIRWSLTGLKGFAQCWCAITECGDNTQTKSSTTISFRLLLIIQSLLFPGHLMILEPKKIVWHSSAGKRKQSWLSSLPEILCKN